MLGNMLIGDSRCLKGFRNQLFGCWNFLRSLAIRTLKESGSMKAGDDPIQFPQLINYQAKNLSDGMVPSD